MSIEKKKAVQSFDASFASSLCVLQQPTLPAPPPLARASLVLLGPGRLGGRLVDVRVELRAPERHLAFFFK